VTSLAPPASFPLTISKPGCYALKGVKWTVPDANTTAIKITAANVVLNLNNREIQGPNTCPIGAAGPVCALTGTGIGIDAPVRDATILNGRVHGFGAQGIRLGIRGHLQDLRISENGGAGILGNDFVEVELVVSEQNGGSGFVGGEDVSVVGSRFNDNAKKGLITKSNLNARDIRALRNIEEGLKTENGLVAIALQLLSNGGTGCSMGDNGEIHQSIAKENKDGGCVGGDNALFERFLAILNHKHGVKSGKGTKIKDSNGSGNDDHGFLLDSGSDVDGCIASNNKTGVGLMGTADGGRIFGCTVKGNTDFGLDMSTTTSFGSNALSDNPTPHRLGVDAGSNVCGSALCP
jgi:hypothetical protein